MEAQQRGILRRRRCAPNRKWSEQEQKNLIKYVMEHKPFESPNGELYYRKFLMEQNLNIEWRLVRYKVRNLKVSYMRARDWVIRNAEGVLKEAKNPQELLNSIYPLYDDLEALFGDEVLSMQNRVNEQSLAYANVEDSRLEQEDVKTTFNNSTDHSDVNGIYTRADHPPDALHVHELYEEDTKPILNLHNTYNNVPEHAQESNNSFTNFSDASFSQMATTFQENESVSGINSRRCTNDHLSARTVKNVNNRAYAAEASQNFSPLEELKKQQIQLELRRVAEELHLKKMEFELKQEQWKFEKERQLQELQLRDAETKSKEKLKILEIKFEKWKYRQELAFKERMAQREIDMKGKIATLDIELKK